MHEGIVGDHGARPHGADEVVATKQPTRMGQERAQKHLGLRPQHDDRAVVIARQFASLPIEGEAIETQRSDVRIDLAHLLGFERDSDRQSFGIVSAIHHGRSPFRD